jgi:hypothetical protein
VLVKNAKQLSVMVGCPDGNVVRQRHYSIPHFPINEIRRRSLWTLYQSEIVIFEHDPHSAEIVEG